MGYIQVNKNKTFIYCQVNLRVWGRRKNHSYNALSLLFVVLCSFSFGIVFGEYMHV